VDFRLWVLGAPPLLTVTLFIITIVITIVAFR
jgi:hypothetical protein